MSTRLDQLLAAIDPSRTYDAVFARADEAINTFGRVPAQITNWDDFRLKMGEFLAHVEAKILRLNAGLTAPDFNSDRCLALFGRIYGSGGAKTAFEMARTGNEGGFLAVLRTVTLRMAEEYTEREIAAHVGQYWQELSPDEQLAATSEYIKKYGHLLPSEMTEASAARVRGNFLNILKQHARVLQKTRRIGR